MDSIRTALSKNHFFSLKDILESTEYPPLRVLTICPNPDEVEIKHVTSIERTTKGFIRRGEFVLTTATSWDTPEKFLNFVTEIYAGGAVAIAFSFLDETYTIPQSVLHFAKEKHFTLFQIPWQYRFADVIYYIQMQIENRQVIAVETWNELQNALLSSYLQHETLNKAITLISDHLQADVLLTDKQNCPIADSTHAVSKRDPVPMETLNAYYLYTTLMQRGYVLAKVYLKKEHITPQEIESFKPFSSNILIPLTLWFDRKNIIKNTQAQLIDDLIWELANGSFRYSEDNLTQARMLGLHLNVPYRCIVGRICSEEYATNSWLDDNIFGLKEAVIQARWSAMVTIRNRYVIAYIGEKENPEAYIKRFSEAISKYEPRLGCTWGVSDLRKERDFDKLFMEARLCANICRVEQGPGNTYYSENTRLFQMLLPILKDQNTMATVQRKLDILLNQKETERKEIVRILNTFYRNNCNTSATARELFYSRQTLRYKLKKIEELFNMSFDLHDQVLYLELCLRLYDFYGSMATLDLGESFPADQES